MLKSIFIYILKLDFTLIKSLLIYNPNSSIYINKISFSTKSYKKIFIKTNRNINQKIPKIPKNQINQKIPKIPQIPQKQFKNSKFKFSKNFNSLKMSKDAPVEEIYQKLTQLEHILLRPDTYSINLEISLII